MPPKPKAPLEAEEQRKVARWLDKRAVWCHVPNEGRRSARTGQHLRLQGLKKGFPDIIVFSPVCCVIELKRVRGSKGPSPEQREWLAFFEGIGWPAAVCYGHKEAIEQLKKWGV